jgi:hypothetical protein
MEVFRLDARIVEDELTGLPNPYSALLSGNGITIDDQVNLRLGV